MPQLKIKNEETTVERLPMDSLKKAVAYVQTLPDSKYLKYFYSTTNEKTRIENTVEIRQNQTASQWT